MARGFDVSNGQQWSCSSGFNCDPYQSNVSKQPFGSHTHPADSGPRDATLPRVHFLSTLLLLREELLQSRSSRRRLIQLRRSDDLIHLFFLSIIHSYRNPRRTPDFPHFFLHFFFFFPSPTTYSAHLPSLKCIGSACDGIAATLRSTTSHRMAECGAGNSSSHSQGPSQGPLHHSIL
jgi:hypothetical protein